MLRIVVVHVKLSVVGSQCCGSGHTQCCGGALSQVRLTVVGCYCYDSLLRVIVVGGWDTLNCGSSQAHRGGLLLLWFKSGSLCWFKSGSLVVGCYAEQWKSSVANTEAGKWIYGEVTGFHKNFTSNLIKPSQFAWNQRIRAGQKANTSRQKESKSQLSLSSQW